MESEPRTISAGQQVLHYRLTEKLGEGGMGVVWKATDTTLDREVAIKVLPSLFAADPERLARFEREAKLLASLNHPNIATVYSVHTVDGVRYLAMEWVPGEDLTQRIARGPVPVVEAVEIARQIALALEAAHESGVVHRDLKPANVRLMPDGRVKVLDFGLAKALEAAAPAASLSQSPTLVATAMGGTILGTAAYMSPEQARGKSVDRRADIWAFGVVFYEMLTGRRAFEGETISDILAAVLRAEPDRAHLPGGLPRELRRLIDRCLDKDPRRRLRDIGEALVVIEDLQSGRADTSAPVVATAPRAGTSGRERLLWGLGLVAAAAVAAFAGMRLQPAPTPPPLRRFTLALRQGQGDVLAPMVSPDGRRIAYLQGRRLWVRDLGQLTSRMLAEGLDEDFRPAWSPDGASLLFAAGPGLKRVDTASGAITPLCHVPDFTGGSGGCWTEDGRILFTKGADHVYSVAAGGGVPEVYLAKIDSVEADLHHPHVLPDGRGVLVVRHLPIGGPRILAVVHEGRRKDLLELPSGFLWEPVYDPRGYIVFSRIGEGQGLWALPFSLEKLERTGEPFLIAPAGSAPSIAEDGTLVYGLAAVGAESRIVLIDEAGAVVDTLTDAWSGIWNVALSPDGGRLAVEARDGSDSDLWLVDLMRRGQSRFAFGSARQANPAWFPDGARLAYEEYGVGLYLKPTDGSAAERFLTVGVQPCVSPDGRQVVFSRVGADGTSDLWRLALEGPADSSALDQSAGAQTRPAIAPQGSHVLYTSDESGRAEIYLKQFPSGAGRWQVSTEGGTYGVWGLRGDRIYYREADRVFEVDVDLAPAVRLGAPQLLFDLGELKLQSWGRNVFLPTARPDRFVALRLSDRPAESPADAILVQNWTRDFEKPKP